MPFVAPKALNGLYFFCEPLAEGSFGQLYIALHALTRQKVAIKILDKRKLGTDAFRVRSEIEALKLLNHKYIYKLYQVVETDSFFYLVVEFLPGGELFDYILQKEHLSEIEARVIFRQIVSAIGYVHSKGFAHRDLKPENILLDSDQNVRIIDFGLCAKNTANCMLDTFCGSFAYAAPEVLANKEYSGSAADLWSLGVILYALLCGCLPFDPTKPEELTQKIGKGLFAVPDSLSKSSRNLLSQLMCVDPKKRIKIDELRRHPWIVEGFMGHPVDIHEEKIPLHPMNMCIVAEISGYTRIPKVEMVRMLHRRSYDYLMATYMIMETALEEDNVLIHLHPRRHNDDANVLSRFYRTYEDAKTSASIQSVSIPSDGSESSSVFRVPLATCSSSNQQSELADMCLNHYGQLSQKCSMSSYESFDQNPISNGENCSPYPQFPQTSDESAMVDKYIFAERVQMNARTDLYDQPPLSPSRSIDSQLAQLTRNFREFQFPDAQRSTRTCGNLGSDSSMSASMDTAYIASISSVSSASSNVPRESNRSNSLGEELSRPGCSMEDRNSSAVNGPPWLHFGRLRDVLTPKKPVNIPDGRLSSDRLRKTRHLHNVFLVRPDLSPSQVFDRVAAALHQHAIRFTIKGYGFLCVIENDWGKTVLSFELELVHVSTRGVEAAATVSVKRRMTLKPRPIPQISGNVPLTLEPLAPSGPNFAEPVTVVSADVRRTQSRESTDNSVVHNDGSKRGLFDKRLGLKMKRLRGDSFMYTSLCRTILDVANVRAGQ